MSKLPIHPQATLKENLYTLSIFFSVRFKDIWIFALCFVLIIVLNTNNLLSSTLRIRATYTIAKVYEWLNFPLETMHLVSNGIGKYIQIMRANKKLREENSDLKHRLNQMQSDISYNASLKKLLHVVESVNDHFVTAKVISKNFDTFQMNLLINAGSKDGIRKNDIVINDQGLIGRIVEVSDNASRILTIADPKSKLPVIFKDSGEQAILLGNQNQKTLLKVKYLSNVANIKNQEQVVTSGIGGIFPFGTYVGKAKKMKEDALVSTSINWNRLDYVVVIIKR